MIDELIKVLHPQEVDTCVLSGQQYAAAPVFLPVL